jgi:O-antigen ligase
MSGINGVSGIRTPRRVAGRPTWQDTWTPTFVAFLAYTFIIVTYKLGIATVVMTLALGSVVSRAAVVRVPRFLWLFTAWLAWAALGYIVTPYAEQVGPALVAQAKVLLVAFVAVNALRTTTQVRYFVIFLLASYVLVPIRAALVNYVTGYRLFDRAIGPFIYNNPNDLAALTILVLGAALALWASAPRKSVFRWIGLAAAVPLVLTVILTQSRGAFLALAAVALPSGIALVRHRPRVVPVLAALVAVALYLAPATFWDRVSGMRKAASFETIGEMDPEGSARERLAVLRTAARIVADHPLLGVGVGAYANANAEYSPAVGLRDAHNTYVNVVAETGLPGLVFFLGLVGSVLRSARDARRRAARASPAAAEMLRWLQYGVVAYLIAGLFGSFSKFAFLYIFLALLWSASQAILAEAPPESPWDSPPLPDRQRRTPHPPDIDSGVAVM